MKFGSIIVANLLRKKVRLVLTIGSFATALFLFAFLGVVRNVFKLGGAVAAADRLVVINRASFLNLLPLSYQDRILRIPNLKFVTHVNWFAGIYQDQKYSFPQFAIDPANHRQTFSEYSVSEEQWKAFLKDRQGAIAGDQLVERFHWKIGDRIPIKSPLYGNEAWEFNLVGIYRSNRPQQNTNQFWFQWEYFEEKVPQSLKGQVSFYFVRVNSTDDAVSVASAIDSEFKNSPFETKSASESTFVANRVKELGNIQVLILIIGTVVLFTLLLVTENTMAISVRERTAELTIFKAIGFSNLLVLFLVLAESLVIALVGGTIGLTLASLAIPVLARALSSVIPHLFLSRSVLLFGLGAAILVGTVDGLMAGAGAMRLRVAKGLRKV